MRRQYGNTESHTLPHFLDKEVPHRLQPKPVRAVLRAWRADPERTSPEAGTM